MGSGDVMSHYEKLTSLVSKSDNERQLYMRRAHNFIAALVEAFAAYLGAPSSALRCRPWRDNERRAYSVEDSAQLNSRGWWTIYVSLKMEQASVPPAGQRSILFL